MRIGRDLLLNYIKKITHTNLNNDATALITWALLLQLSNSTGIGETQSMQIKTYREKQDSA